MTKRISGDYYGRGIGSYMAHLYLGSDGTADYECGGYVQRGEWKVVSPFVITISLDDNDKSCKSETTWRDLSESGITRCTVGIHKLRIRANKDWFLKWLRIINVKDIFYDSEVLYYDRLYRAAGRRLKEKYPNYEPVVNSEGKLIGIKIIDDS